MRRLLFVFVLIMATAMGCTVASQTPKTPRHLTASPAPTSSWPLPDGNLTPGAVLSSTDTSRICPHVDPALEAARPSSADKAANYKAYGLSYPQPFGVYEDDHLVPIELYGDPNNQKNLWPEKNDTPNPADIAKWHLSPPYIHNSKDILEDALHQLVCSGRVPLATAQQAIENNWPQAYVTYVQGMQP